MGELDISVLLGQTVATAADTAAAGSAGWGGDRLVSLDGPDGAWAIVWQTAWDSERRRGRVQLPPSTRPCPDLDGAHAVLSGTDIAGGLDAPVLVLVASSPDTLQQVQQALGVGR